MDLHDRKGQIRAMTNDAWRPMTAADLTAVERIGETVHPQYPEDPGVLADRQRLYPEGCFVLMRGQGSHGYAFAHPWRLGQPPKLNTRLDRLPDDADTFYLHDVALLPAARGLGFGDAIVDLLLPQARRFASWSLIAVGRSAPFWHRHGFMPARYGAIRETLLSYGPEAQLLVRYA